MSKNYLIQIIFLILITALSVLSWHWLKNTLNNNTAWFWPIGGFFVLSLLLGLDWLIIKPQLFLNIAFGLIALSFFFSLNFKLVYLGALFIAFLCFISGSRQAIKEKNLLVKIKVNRILKRGLPPFITGICLVASLIFFFSPLSAKNQIQINIPKPLFNVLIKPLIDIFQNQTPDGQLTEKNTIMPSQNETEEMIYQTINQGLNRFSLPYKQYFPLGLTIGFFLTIRILCIVFMELIILVDWLIFKLLILLKVFKIEKKMVEKEEIIF